MDHNTTLTVALPLPSYAGASLPVPESALRPQPVAISAAVTVTHRTWIVLTV
jgi:hypothetical protein